mmetsp:Transcript_14860/g.28806  ORF Transcript_14860/g.28806 Transcript_14860/m.28806 type:complete len:299 (-) Transcript_14860:1539-2435(-)|eukprot:CAMPEP_0171489084 /NCGR_PEP_ID=MMETSP0958-20121227/2557_1 /TAXON_ID=87120 /ORGANISM="Aurantiochytrium limacinum, Strain ATCCMYA-1381" /LENGTH=298 /DNA_ID=CAMNT_0012022251 /DNA_START=462 /DNA_END=1358 /DNA_ORIENTATION=-
MSQSLAASEDTKIVDGKSYTINQSMLRASTMEPKGNSTQALLAASWAAGMVFSPKVRSLTGVAALGSVTAVGLLYVAMRSSKTISASVTSRILPPILEDLDNEVGEVRTELLKDMKGKVLDFGAGDGHYLRYVAKRKDQVESVTCLEPLKALHPSIKQRAADLDLSKVEIYGGFSSDLLKERGPGQYDFVIIGNVLCEVPDQDAVVNDIYELLRPGGKVFYIEHVASHEGTFNNKLQRFINPLWKVISGGCNCDRHSMRALKAVPWKMYEWELQMSFPLTERMVMGLAIKPTGTAEDH